MAGMTWLALLAAFAASSADRTPAKVFTITISEMAFSAAPTLAVAGDAIEWTNRDVVAHTVTAKNGAWDVTVAPGKTVRITMKSAGTFDYFCRFHPNMTSRIVVKRPKWQ
jgi:plastocyanin